MILIVGGQHRKIGKTALIEALVRRFPSVPWTAVKITTHHGPAGSEELRVLEETLPSPETDTGRYLAAGAARAYLVQCAGGAVRDACEALRGAGILRGPVVIESGAAAEYLDPALFLFLADADPEAEAKESARRRLSRADAFVVTAPRRPGPIYRLRLPAGRPRFYVRPPEFRSRPLIEFVAARLGLRAQPFSRPPGERVGP